MKLAAAIIALAILVVALPASAEECTKVGADVPAEEFPEACHSGVHHEWPPTDECPRLPVVGGDCLVIKEPTEEQEPAPELVAAAVSVEVPIVAIVVEPAPGMLTWR